MRTKTNKGFTLLELLIALAILAIIAAILIPNFFVTTDRARLRSDIQSARVIQNAIDLYNAERTPNITGNINDAILVRLYDAGFLRERTPSPQTYLAEWATRDNLVVVDINLSLDNVHRIYAGLPAHEQAFVINGRRP